MQQNRGFTLVELIIVISIVALLSTIGITTYGSVQKDARNVRRKADLKELKTTLEGYKAKNGSYPTTVNRTGCPGASLTDPGWCGTCANYNVGNIFNDSGATGYIPDLAPEFIPKLPRDPRESKTNSSSSDPRCGADAGTNCYLYRSNGDDYKLLAHCTPEGTLTTRDAFFDPTRYDSTKTPPWFWAWQVSSSSSSLGW